ncbi:hypothetical protein LC612_11610 [Nostoc sp. CHAB 5834]|nr:hypothetical protein [Nostoc sp. CHAB 5834]
MHKATDKELFEPRFQGRELVRWLKERNTELIVAIALARLRLRSEQNKESV